MTMDISAAIWIIAGIAILLLVFFMIPLLLQLWRAAKGVNTTIQTINHSLPGILKNLEEMTTHVNRTTTTIHRQVEDLSQAFQKIQGTINLMVGVEEIFRRGIHTSFARKLRTYSAIVKGTRVFLSQLMSRRT
mgnify:CR=1 FL=1